MVIGEQGNVELTTLYTTWCTSGHSWILGLLLDRLDYLVNKAGMTTLCTKSHSWLHGALHGVQSWLLDALQEDRVDQGRLHTAATHGAGKASQLRLLGLICKTALLVRPGPGEWVNVKGETSKKRSESEQKKYLIVLFNLLSQFFLVGLSPYN